MEGDPIFRRKCLASATSQDNNWARRDESPETEKGSDPTTMPTRAKVVQQKRVRILPDSYVRYGWYHTGMVQLQRCGLSATTSIYNTVQESWGAMN